MGSVGIVSPGYGLVGNLSASDLRGLESQHFGLLALPAKEFIEMMVQRRLQLEKMDTNNSYGVKGMEKLKPLPLYSCYPDSRLCEVV